MVQTFLLFDIIANEKTVNFMQREVTSTITWHLGLEGSNNFGEYTSFSPFTLITSSEVFIRQGVMDVGVYLQFCLENYYYAVGWSLAMLIFLQFFKCLTLLYGFNAH